MKLGLPYQGSKSPLMHSIMEMLPPATHFADLFFGGGAATHAAILSGRYPVILMNDTFDLPIQLFVSCIHGQPPTAKWVSHEDFFAQRYRDAYSGCCFSFGADWNTYAYSRQIEPLKRALHLAVVDCDITPALELGYDLSFIDGITDWRKRYAAVRRGVPSWRGELVHLERLQHLERLSLIERLDGICEGGKLLSYRGDYREVPIPKDTVIYCDPPYGGTKQYRNSVFDKDAFCDWCRQQTELTVISEYDMPPDFIEVLSMEHYTKRAPYVAHRTNERLFIPAHQAERWHDTKLTLL